MFDHMKIKISEAQNTAETKLKDKASLEKRIYHIISKSHKSKYMDRQFTKDKKNPMVNHCWLEKCEITSCVFHPLYWQNFREMTPTVERAQRKRHFQFIADKHVNWYNHLWTAIWQLSIKMSNSPTQQFYF